MFYRKNGIKGITIARQILGFRYKLKADQSRNSGKVFRYINKGRHTLNFKL